MQEALRRFDQANAEDPRCEVFEGQEVARELLYAQRMSEMLHAYAPEASEALHLAVRAQHIRRWEIPRDSYPKDRVGYLRWRQALNLHHREITRAILQEVGYDAGLIEQVCRLLSKKELRSDEESQTLEDVICLVFLRHYLTEFGPQHPEAKVLSILQKTWLKMSERAQRYALSLELDESSKTWVDKALGDEDREPLA